MINKTYIISQIFVTLSFIVSLFAYHRNKKSKIMTTMVLSNVLNLIHYVILGAYSGGITKIVGIFRDSFIVMKDNKKEKYNYVLYMFLIIYIILAIIMYKSILSIFPLLAAMIYIVGIWNANELKVKKVACFCYILWLVYNIYIFSIFAIITNIISIISSYIAIKRYKKIPRK